MTLRVASRASVSLSMQTATRLRCDPTEYARKQQEKRDRATELRTQRQKGFVSEDHTFAPKCVSPCWIFGPMHALTPWPLDAE